MTVRSSQYFIDQIDQTEFHGYALSGWLYSGQTKFQSIEVVESPKFGKMLILDGKVQSAALDEYIYHEVLAHPAMLLHPDPHRVLILGGGEGATLREVLRYRMVEEVVMVDLDEEVVKVCQEYLPEWSAGAFEDSRTTLVCEDARQFLQRSGSPFDVIIHDITDPVTVDFSEAYYRAIQECLTTRGILAMQALECTVSDFDGHLRIRQEVGKVFPWLLSYRAYIPSFRGIWGFVLATTGEELNPLSAGMLAARISERLGPEAGLRFYGPAVHTALCTLPRELAHVIGEKAEWC
jgi:spermidine synthase